MRHTLSRNQLAGALLTLIQDEPDMAVLAEKIAAYVIAEGRISELDLLMRDVERLQHKQTGRLEIHATSARPLTDRVRQSIQALFPAEEQVFHETQDKDLVGGVRVRAQDQVLDLSVRTRLRRLKQSVKA